MRERAGDALAQHLWHEHESPYAKLAEALRAAGIEHGKLGVDPWTRAFIVDGARGLRGRDRSGHAGAPRLSHGQERERTRASPPRQRGHQGRAEGRFRACLRGHVRR
ncbi:hypothetical protein [Nannocystis pusilla]|uniref:hypothetical protein n=1 Tax=Nannocystis pusilla TaxID=889268 RepID=UPI003B7E0D4A